MFFKQLFFNDLISPVIGDVYIKSLLSETLKIEKA